MIYFDVKEKKCHSELVSGSYQYGIKKAIMLNVKSNGDKMLKRVQHDKGVVIFITPRPKLSNPVIAKSRVDFSLPTL